MFIDKKLFRNYKGLEELIPGRIYLDDKGSEIIFLGRGSYRRRVFEGGVYNPMYDWEIDERFLYMKLKDVQRKINTGKLSPDLSKFDGGGLHSTDFAKTVFFSKNPRNLMKEVGIFCNEDKFYNFSVIDLTWHEPDIETRYEIIAP